MKFYEKYWMNSDGHLSDFDLKWPILKKYIPINEQTIVDFGCGKGAIIREMLSFNKQAKYIGLDVSATALEEARKTLPNVEFYKIDEGGHFQFKILALILFFLQKLLNMFMIQKMLFQNFHGY